MFRGMYRGSGQGGGGEPVNYNRVVEKIAVIPSAETAAVGKVYMYMGESDDTYTHGYIYECVSTESGKQWEQLDVQPGGQGGAVESVNGQTGVVILDAEDVGALPDDTHIPVDPVQPDWDETDSQELDYVKNKPQINGVTLIGNKTSADLGIYGNKAIEIANMTTVAGYSVPNPTAEELTAVYNAVVAGNGVHIVDSNDVYYQVLQADSVDDAINVEVLYFSELALLYTLENDTVTVTGKKLGGTVESVNGKTGVVVLGAEDVGALADTTKYVASASWTIDPSTYIMTLQLKDQDGANIGTAQTIDLPLESVVVGGSYDSANKKIVLTLNNGTTIDVPVADLVSGLQSEITDQSPLSADLVDDTNTTHKFVSAAEKNTWNGKQDAINDLATIRSGAAAGATAVQPGALATVATTGAYSDLSGTPTIPTVNNATLTITQGGTTKGTFTANAGTDVTIDVDAGGGSLPSQSGNAGKFLTTDGTDASWGNALSNISLRQSDSLTILGTPCSSGTAGSINIGKNSNFAPFSVFIGESAKINRYAYNGSSSVCIGESSQTGDDSVVIGTNAAAEGSVREYIEKNIIIGHYAKCTRPDSMQFGRGTNSERGTVCFGLYNSNSSSWNNYKLLDTDGTIPEARLADTTNAAQGMVLALDASLNAVWQAGGSGGGISDVTVNGVSVVSGSVATITCATIDDASTTSTTSTWSASKLNTTIGNIETLINAL